ncbi:MAG: Rpn family recombination-promoting nuclease/putative transposase [Alkalispirochaeta sp.]
MNLLLTVETIDGATEYVYVLVEHKSYSAPMVAVQLLGYIGGILKRYRKPPVPIIHPRMHGRAAISTEWIRDQAGGVLPWCENLDRSEGTDRIAPTRQA